MRAALLRGVALDLATLHPQDLDLSGLQSSLPDWSLHEFTRADEAATRLRTAQVAVTNKFIMDAEILAQAPELELICVAATGTNNIDLGAAATRGVTVTNVTGYATSSVVEHVFALILSLQRRLGEHLSAARDQWPQHRDFSILDFPISELAGKTLGIVGYGELGRAVADIGRAFGMRIVIAQRPGGDERGGRVPLTELLASADVVSLHCPLAASTRGLIGADELALMKPTAILINTARGGIVDEAALLSALEQGKLGGAGVDVLIEEPPRHGNPLLVPALPNLIVTPHVAWASREARQRLIEGVVANIRAYQSGNPLNKLC